MATLDQNLRDLIDRLTESARTSKMIAINAALVADQVQRGRLDHTGALKVVATEIQRLSDESQRGIVALHAMYDEVKLLTQTINMAGRQRMLSQKIMKLFLLSRTGVAVDFPLDRRPLAAEFRDNLERLRRCRLNTAPLNEQLARVACVWSEFEAAMAAEDVPAAAALSERVLQEMQAAVQHYERMADFNATAPRATPARAPEAEPAAPAPAGGSFPGATRARNGSLGLPAVLPVS